MDNCYELAEMANFREDITPTLGSTPLVLEGKGVQ
jgi:hypothetical protein